MQNTYISEVHTVFARTDTVEHKTSLSIFGRTEIIQSIFYDHNGEKLKITKKEKSWKMYKICGNPTQS